MRVAVASYDVDDSPAERREKLRYGLQDVVAELMENGEHPDDITEQFEYALEMALDSQDG